MSGTQDLLRGVRLAASEHLASTARSSAGTGDEGFSIGDSLVVDLGEGRLTVGIGPVPEWSTRAAILSTSFLDPAGNEIGLVETRPNQTRYAPAQRTNKPAFPNAWSGR